MLNVFGFFAPSGLSAQAISWQSRIIAAGGTIDSGVLSIIDANLIKPMVAAGIFNCLDKFHLLAGTGNRIASRVNLINSSYTAIENNASFLNWLNNFGFYSTGTTFATGGYLTFGYNPSTAPKWSADRFNCSQFLYLRYFNNTTASNMMGNGTATSSFGVSMTRTAGASANLNVYMNSQATATTNTPMTSGSLSRLWLCGTRTSNTQRAIIDASVVSTTVAPTATILNQEIAELTLIGRTGNPANFDVNGHMASGHGNNNFDNQLLRTYIINTFAALGV